VTIRHEAHTEKLNANVAKSPKAPEQDGILDALQRRQYRENRIRSGNPKQLQSCEIVDAEATLFADTASLAPRRLSEED
jgi:hypothetical protein